MTKTCIYLWTHEESSFSTQERNNPLWRKPLGNHGMKDCPYPWALRVGALLCPCTYRAPLSLQIQIHSTEPISVFQRSKALNCQYPENIQVSLMCFVQSIWRPRESNEHYINVNWLDERVCFDVKISSDPAVYSVSIKITEFSIQHFLLFFGGVLLFFFASNLSRSVVVFYSAGVTLGVAASLIFILLIFKRFIPKHSIFCLLMSGCWVFSAYAIKYLKENITYLWSENKHYIAGYFVVAGLLSFGACYRHGPVTNQRSINLITWTLQLIACFFIYSGLTVPDVAYAVNIVLISSKGLRYPVRALCYLCRKIRDYFTSKNRVVRFLTEEEYRDQADTETCRALEDLRTFCRSPEFNSWLTVSRLSSPNRFADFVLGSSHISPDEANTHEEQFGFGSFFLEEQLFEDVVQQQNQQADFIQEDIEEYRASNHSNHSIGQASSNGNSSILDLNSSR
ncbi:nuclear envelope integral membrane protein 2 [Discoglossus pictus]